MKHHLNPLKLYIVIILNIHVIGAYRADFYPESSGTEELLSIPDRNLFKNADSPQALAVKRLQNETRDNWSFDEVSIVSDRYQGLREINESGDFGTDYEDRNDYQENKISDQGYKDVPTHDETFEYHSGTNPTKRDLADEGEDSLDWNIDFDYEEGLPVHETNVGAKLNETKDIDSSIESVLGRPRQEGSLGQIQDFPTRIQDGMEDYTLDVTVIKIKERVNNFRFRSHGQTRRLKSTVKRWPHQERLDPNEPMGCGFPVCAMVDMKPIRFQSLCNFTGWMRQEGHVRRIIEVQKGGCEDAIESVGLDRDWAEQVVEQCQCGSHEGCNTPICLNDNGHAKSFPNTCSAVQYLKGKTQQTLIAIGLGSCRDLYSACLFTEWFDFDEPCRKADVESVYYSNIFLSCLGKHGRHRSCAAQNIEYPAQFQTLDGYEQVEGLVFSKDKDKVVCYNEHNKVKPKPPHFWVDEEVTCRDFKMRYCCKNLWGEAVSLPKIPKDDVIVDAPVGQTLFDTCDWLNFMSVSNGRGLGDVESRALNAKFMKQSTCKGSNLAPQFIDARTVKDDTPWHETGELITKITPTYGFYCDNKNNEVIGKQCSDYKIRLCCKKESPAQWGKWSEWTECSKSCGSGTKKRDRVCVMKKGEKEGCFNDGPHGEKRFREMEIACNELPCPRDLQWMEWQAWSDCSVTCGHGVRRRHRGCFPPKGGGKECPIAGDSQYSEEQKCHESPCLNPQWTKWGDWSDCSVSCGIGCRSRRRACVDIAAGNAPLDNNGVLCLGPSIHDDACDAGYCPVDGGWTQWQNWGECNVACGEGVRIRRRYCTEPFPMHGGRSCPGSGAEDGDCVDLPECPQHCLFSAWGEWGSCSVTCGDGPFAGTRERQRFEAVPAKNGGNECCGPKSEIEQCEFCQTERDLGQPRLCIFHCPVDCRLSEWSPWAGFCRKCYKPNEKQLVGLLKRTRMRFVEVDAKYGGKQCTSLQGTALTMQDGAETEENPCVPDKDVPPCPAAASPPFFWSPWAEWSACIAACGSNGQRTRKRKCFGNGGSSGCPGKSEEEESCASICPPDGWSEWDEWSPCEKTCGKGQSARRRTCRDDHRLDIPDSEKTCSGIQRETRVCDSGSCDRVEEIITAGKDPTGLVQGQYFNKLQRIDNSTV